MPIEFYQSNPLHVPNQSPQRPSGDDLKGLEGFLVRYGLAKDKSTARAILIIFALVCIFASIWILKTPSEPAHSTIIRQQVR